MDIIDEVKEVVTTTIVVVTGMQDSRTTEVDATRSKMFMRGLINTMMQERKMLEMIMKKIVIDVEEKDWSCICRNKESKK